jgi:cadmium resistance protein CadD (predicted permease)
LLRHAILSAGLFATTNVDDLFVLVGLFSGREFPRWQVVVGQIVGIAVLIMLSVAAAKTAIAISPAHVGLLGIAPLVLGVVKLSGLRDRARSEVRSESQKGRLRFGGAPGVAAITIANGADNIGVYTPLFAVQTPGSMVETIAIFAALTLAWCFGASVLVNHPALGRPVRRYGRLVLPVVLIWLGAWIMYQSGAIGLVGRLAR